MKGSVKERAVEISPYSIPGVDNPHFNKRLSEKDFDNIMQVVTNTTGIGVQAIKGTIRKAPIVQARHLFCYVTKLKTTGSLKKIAAYIGGRDHTTVINAIRTIKNLSENEQELRCLIKEIESKVDKLPKAV